VPSPVLRAYRTDGIAVRHLFGNELLGKWNYFRVARHKGALAITSCNLTTQELTVFCAISNTRTRKLFESSKHPVF
jgi:hypothetical protein